ncbi:MAG: radical SAM family heme chaperone HemW [Clostridia bacterium]|nr:radical SAM family heme chaperone HemW [Clostridia bacterium]
MAGIYIHIPFCIKKCSYCDFVSYTNYDEELQRVYTRAVIDELQALPFKAQTLFIGGGTPTALSADLLCAIISEAVKKEPTEITVEANPETVTADYAKRLYDSGVNRISMGLQSADDNLLKKIGRVHNTDRFLKAYEYIRNAGFTNVNVDIMYGLPGQNEEQLNSTVKTVLSLSPEHISAYALTLAKGTPLYNEVKAGNTALPGDDYNWQLNLKGYDRYEISNYAKKGKECKHNINYWQNGSYYGIGCAAHGSLTLDEAKAWGFVPQNCCIVRTEHSPVISEYIAGKKPVCNFVSENEAMFETVMLGLRMIKGVDKKAFADRFNTPLEHILKKYISSNTELIKDEGGYIRLTEKGLDIQNTVLVDLMDLFY